MFGCKIVLNFYFKFQNTHTIYVLYTNSSFLVPWFSIGIWSQNGLWANVNDQEWINLGQISSQLLLNWLHICLNLNIVKGSIETFVGGKSLALAEGVKNLKPPGKVYLRLGIVDHSYWETNHQFHGKISNINIYKKTHNPCDKEIKDSLINWSEMEWRVVGNDVSEIDVEDDFCTNFKFTHLRFPLRWGRQESKNICKKFGNGTLLDFDDPSDLSLFDLKLLYGSRWDFDYCECLWSAYIINSMGEIINENTNETVRLDL